MTLDDLERRNSPYFAFFSPISISLLAKYFAVVEHRPILSVPVFHFWPLLTHPAARSLCDSWATCEYSELLKCICFAVNRSMKLLTNATSVHYWKTRLDLGSGREFWHSITHTPCVRPCLSDLLIVIGPCVTVEFSISTQFPRSHQSSTDSRSPLLSTARNHQ